MNAITIDDVSPAAVWEPKRRLSLAQARRRARFLKVWKFVCIIIAASAAGSIVAVLSLHTMGGGFRFERTLPVSETLTMISPRFTGRDSNGTPFQITARTAVRRGPTADAIDLEAPRFEGREGQTVTALRGVYEPQAQRIELIDNVVYQDQQGRSFVTTHAFVDALENVIRGAAAIEARSRLGEVRADAYELREQGGQLIMRGKVHGVIEASPPPPPQ
jgi:lipopolysaccharide export system protein LptC